MRKYIALAVVVSLLACSASAWLGYRRGLCDGYIAGAAPDAGYKFVMSLADLQDLRANRTQPVIDRLEGSCYNAAGAVLELGYQKGRPSLNRRYQDLLAYRAQYAKPPEQWTPVEKALVESIKVWRSGGDTETRQDPAEIAQLSRLVKYP